VSDSPAQRAPITLLAAAARRGPGPRLCTRPGGLAGAPPRAGNLMSAESRMVTWG
jgi:hypothetical protein